MLTSKGGDDSEIYALHRLNGEQEDAKLGLHFDLTVPIARYVAQHYSQLSFPFRRYQIQKIWRGERPQAGRAREFTQADIDIVADGELPLFAHVEVVAVIHSVFRALGFDTYVMRINNRKILRGFFESLEIPEDTIPHVVRTVDKVDKIGLSKLEQELQTLLASQMIVSSILEYLGLRSLSNSEKLAYLEAIRHPLLAQGVIELREVYERLIQMGVEERFLSIDPAIARGLDYYTGTIFETFDVDNVSFGSLASGGAYADLASHFIDRSLPGVGGSIGVTRLLQLFLQSGKRTPVAATPTRVLITRVQEEYIDRYVALLSGFRDASIPAEIVLSASQKIGKQIAYADKKGIPYVLIAGEDEFAKNVVAIKKLKTGETREFALGSDMSEWLF